MENGTILRKDFVAWLIQRGACKEAMRWVKRQKGLSVEELYEKCDNASFLDWVFGEMNEHLQINVNGGGFSNLIIAISCFEETNRRRGITAKLIRYSIPWRLLRPRLYNAVYGKND